jgi:hypothetical protein
MKMEQVECSETLAFKLQMLDNHPEESMQHLEHSESLKSRNFIQQPEDEIVCHNKVHRIH